VVTGTPTSYVTFSLFAADGTTPAQKKVTPKFTAGGTMEYSTDTVTWNSVTSGTAYTSSTGGLIYFRGTFAENRLFTTNASTNAWATSASKMKVSGNLNALLNYASPPDTVGENCYAYMFYGCTSLVDVSGLTLPAATLGYLCYGRMFAECTSLVNAPALPATTLAESCYAAMFLNCKSLVNAPALPVTTLAESCYGAMFAGCSSLVNAPALPATTLTNRCYINMFETCTSLVNAPALPAVTLAEECYRNMFTNCTSLRVLAVAVDFTNTVPDYALSGMYNGVTAGGTFYAGNTTMPLTPTGWTRKTWAQRPY
jgi:hypothetical protein